MGTTEHTNAITVVIDEAVEVLRVATETDVFDADDLIARMLRARTRVESVATVVRLAECFVRLIEPSCIDPGTAVVGRDLFDAIRRAKGLPGVREHYEALARDAQQVAA